MHLCAKHLRVLVGLPGLLFFAGNLQAAVVNIGGFNIDDSKEVSGLSQLTGFSDTFTHPFSTLGNLGNNWGSLVDPLSRPNRVLSLNDDFGTQAGTDQLQPASSGSPNSSVLASFESSISNSAGFDALFFELGDPPADVQGGQGPIGAGDPGNGEIEYLAASLDGTAGSFVDLSVLGFIPAALIGGLTDSRGVYVFGLDLDIFQVSEISSIFIGNSRTGFDWDPDVVYAAGTAVVSTPLPAGLPLLLTALVGLGLVRRKVRRATL